MNKAILLALLCGGIILLVFGVPAYSLADSDGVATLIGAGGLLRGETVSRKS